MTAYDTVILRIYVVISVQIPRTLGMTGFDSSQARNDSTIWSSRVLSEGSHNSLLVLPSYVDGKVSIKSSLFILVKISFQRPIKLSWVIAGKKPNRK